MMAPRYVAVSVGESLLLWHEGKIILRVTALKDTSYFTSWDAFVGTPQQVQDKVIELGLTPNGTTAPKG